MKHTPGPWKIETVPTSVGICHKIGPFPGNGPREETRACIYVDGAETISKTLIAQELGANARLIAAAPDLLAALVEVVTISDRKHDAWDRAHAAISKAIGEHAKI